MGEIEEHPGIFSGREQPAGSGGARRSAAISAASGKPVWPRREFDEVAASAMLMGVLFADAMGRDIMPDMYRNEPEEALDQYVRLFFEALASACAGRHDPEFHRIAVGMFLGEPVHSGSLLPVGPGMRLRTNTTSLFRGA